MTRLKVKLTFILMALSNPFVEIKKSYSGPIEFKYFGFDLFEERSYLYQNEWRSIKSEMQQQGLNDIFSGHGFYNGLPVKAYEAIWNQKEQELKDWKIQLYQGLLNSLSGFTFLAPWTEKFQYVNPLAQETQFTVFGRFPSLPARELETGTPQVAHQPIPLGQSVFAQEDQNYLNHNCFVCHAGIAYSSQGPTVIAGLANHYIDQYALMQESRAVADTLENSELIAQLRLKLAQWGTPLTVSDEKQIQIFIKKVRTSIQPTFRFADTLGYNAGPFVVWGLFAQMINPKQFGFQTFDFNRNDPNHLELGQQDWSRFKAVLKNSLEEPEILNLYNQAYDDFKQLQNQVNQFHLPTVAPNAWFLRKFRKTYGYWYGDPHAGFDTYAGVHFALNFTDEHPSVNEDHRAHSNTITSILNFVNSTQPPPYPGRLDSHLVEQGHKIFHSQSCTECHGNYRKQLGFENQWGTVGHWIVDLPVQTLINVGTDGKYNTVLQKIKGVNQFLAGRGQERMSGLLEFWRGKGDPHLAPHFSLPEKSGYMPPPLVGLWATGPYFHNGSVPELEQVLDSKIRPRVWKKMDLSDPDEISQWDPKKVGIPNIEVNPSELAAHREFKNHLTEKEKDPIYIYSKEYLNLRRIYDTSDDGKSNVGHTYGDLLTHEERQAVIEFLKSISGESILSQDDLSDASI